MHRKKKNYHFSISEFRIFQTLPSLVFQKLSIRRAQFYFSQRPNIEERFNSNPPVRKKKEKNIAREENYAPKCIDLDPSYKLSLETKTTDEFHANYNELYRGELAPFF